MADAKATYTHDEVVQMLKECVHQTVVEERAYLLALLKDQQERETLAQMQPAGGYVN